MARYLAGALLAIAAFAASAQMYRWTDEKGRVHFGSTPPPGAKSVQRKELPASAPAAGAVAEPYALQQARKNFPVTLYSAPGSDSSDQARKLLNARGVPFTEVSTADSAGLERLKNAADTSAVPVLIVGRTVQRGFNPDVYHRLLDEAGYPKTGALPPRAQGAAVSVEPAVPAPPGKPASEATARPGLYDPSGLTGPELKPGRYDPSGLQGPPPKPGRYGTPEPAK